MWEQIDEKVDRMPQPEFIDLSNNPSITFTTNARVSIALTINWQWVLAQISQALIARQSREIINLLAADLDLLQLTKNAVNDIQHLIREQVDENVLDKTKAQITSVKNLLNEYINSSQTNNLLIDRIINESRLAICQLQSLEVVGSGAFMIAASLQLALLQEKAKVEAKHWSNVKAKAAEYSKYSAIVTPRLFQLTVGKIDKICSCKKWETRTIQEIITEYECRYFDGKDIHIFRELSPSVIKVCNKHRLQMFYTVTNNVNYTAVRPIREAGKKLQELAKSI